MEDVALRANVSQMTVSRALRSPEKVQPATLQRIQDAIRETGYVPNLVASSLASNRSTVCAAIIPSITHVSLQRTIETLMAALRRRGLHLLLGTSGETVAEEADLIAAMLAQRPCGLVLHNTRHTQAARAALEKARIPIVESGDLTRTPVDMCVGYSNRAAAHAMTAYLIGRGYRHVAIANVALGVNDRSKARLRGYQDALREAGRPVDPALSYECGHGFAGGMGVMRAIIEGGHAVDALFCATGALALGALHECRRQGWAVPDRIAVAGYEDDEVTESAIPALTTIRIPRAEIGQHAADMLLARLGGQAVPEPVVDVGFEIVPRAST